MTRDTATICYTVDQKYFEFFLVSLHSLISSKHESTKLLIYVILDQMSNKNDAVIKLLETSSVKIVVIHNDSISQCHTASSSYISDATFTRLHAPDILSGESKVLYLDSDTIVRDDILDLFNIDIEGIPLAATKEWTLVELNNAWEYTRYIREEFPFNGQKYFNAGIILMNLDFMRIDGLSSKYRDLLSQHPEFKYNDQDILNWIYGDRMLELDPKWNCQCSLYFTDNFDGYHKYNDDKSYMQMFNRCYGTQYENFMHVFLEGKILHFVGNKENCLKCKYLKDIYNKEKQKLTNALSEAVYG